MIEAKKYLSYVNNPPWVFGLTLVFYLCFVAYKLDRENLDVSRLITAGDRFCDRTQTPSGLFILKKSDGYDGQFYYRLALNPWTRKLNDFGIALDAPGIRSQRILYPFLVWLVTGGHGLWVPWGMVLVNVFCLGLLAALAGSLLQEGGIHALWGAVLAFYPGFRLSLLRDLTEILAATLVVLALRFLHRRRTTAGAVALSLAVLSKEPALLVSVSAGFFLLYRSIQIKSYSFEPEWKMVLLPIFVYAAWQARTYAVWHVWPTAQGGAWFGQYPLSGPLSWVTNALRSTPRKMDLWGMGFLLVGFVFGILSFRASSASSFEKTTWLFYSLLGFCLSNIVWMEAWGFMRVFSEWSVFLGLIVLRMPAPWRRWYALATFSAWFHMA